MTSKAEKFGAKDCAFCHTLPSGGNKWNARGKWLIAEKKRRPPVKVWAQMLLGIRRSGQLRRGSRLRKGR